MVKTKVQRLKNGTLIISIPKTLAELVNLTKGDYVRWSFKEKKLVLKKIFEVN